MSPFLDLKTIQDARDALADEGMLLLAGAYDARKCDEIVRWMEEFPDERGDEQHYAGTELRIWDSQKKHGLMEEFLAQCDVFISCMEASDIKATTLLAIRNRSVAAGDQAVQLGRWHIDSFRRQLKIFLFPCEVTAETGPFEFIQGTHRRGFKARMALKGVYFRPSDFIARKRRYTRLDDRWIDRIGEDGYRPRPVLCPAGTIMIVDTSAIHRARPCFTGTRYALTAYYK